MTQRGISRLNFARVLTAEMGSFDSALGAGCGKFQSNPVIPNQKQKPFGLQRLPVVLSLKLPNPSGSYLLPERSLQTP